MTTAKDAYGDVMVVGGGISGIQAALDLATSGYKVFLVEKEPTIGGKMAQLDKTFPTNDCSMCILSPKLVECGRHLNIDIITNAQVKLDSQLPVGVSAGFVVENDKIHLADCVFAIVYLQVSLYQLIVRIEL